MTEPTSSSPAASDVSRWRRPARLWRALTEPLVSIREPEHRRRARVLSALLLVTVLAGILAFVLTLFETKPRPAQARAELFWLELIGILLLTGLYGLSRTRYTLVAAVCTIGVVVLASFAAAVASPDIELVLAFPVIGIVMSGMFLAPRATSVVVLVTLAATLVVPAMTPNQLPSGSQNAWFFVLTVGALVVVAAALRRQDIEQIEAQSQALVDRETHLRAAIEDARQANDRLSGSVEILERRTAEITLLSQMAEMLQTCHNADEAYAVIGQFAHRLFPSTSGAVYVINASRNYLEAMSAWGDASAQLGGCIFTLSDCWALRRGLMHLLPDGASGLPCQHVAACQRTDFPSVCVPMLAQGEALGVLHLEADAAPRQMTEARQRLAQAVAEQLALTFANLKLRETLQHQSIRDPLTGLFNRRYLEETFERELLRAARHQSTLGVIMIDVDHFKRFNDTFGHEAGDVLLQELGGFLTARIRGSDIACRYGGEEFALILPDSPLEVTRRRAEEMREGAATLRVSFRGRPLGPITLSLGVASFPAHGLNRETLLRLADAALYRAKQDGRNRAVTAQT